MDTLVEPDIAASRQITPLSDGERQARVAARAAEIMRELGHGDYLSPGGPAWGQAQIDARDKALAQAQTEVEVEHGVAVWRPRDAIDGVDWTLSPRIRLKRALAEHAEAMRLRDTAGEVARRAAERMAACEDELKRFASLDHEIEAFHLSQLREGLNDDLPWQLHNAARDRSAAQDRAEHSGRAQQKLESELRAAERQVQEKLRICQAWVVRLITDHANELAEQWQVVQDEANARRDTLAALGYAHFPGQAGPAPVSKRVKDVVNAQVTPAEQNFAALQPRMAEWMAEFGRLLADPEASIDVG